MAAHAVDAAEAVAIHVSGSIDGFVDVMNRRARALGMRVVRLLSVSEGGGYAVPPPMPMYARAEAASMDAQTKIDPGEQQVQVTVAMSFELQ